MCLQQFVGRSVAANLYHVTIPASLTLVIMFYRAGQWSKGMIEQSAMSAALKERWQAGRCGVLGMIAVAGLGLATRLADGTSYENLLWMIKSKRALAERRSATFCPNLGVLLPKNQAECSSRIGQKMKRLCAAGKTVAVLDFADTRYYLSGDCPPWGRYSPLIAVIHYQSQLRELESDLAKKHPDYLLIKADRGQAMMEVDVWQSVHRVLSAKYRIEEEAAPFRIWRWNGG
jgi:hypothetical protein